MVSFIALEDGSTGRLGQAPKAAAKAEYSPVTNKERDCREPYGQRQEPSPNGRYPQVRRGEDRAAWKVSGGRLTL